LTLILKNDNVFFHIPKTGGSWVTSVLDHFKLVDRPVGNKHFDQDHFYFWASRHDFAYPAPFSFCFVRNPVSWYESWYKYMSGPSKNWRPWGINVSGQAGWHPNVMLNGLGSTDFNTFVANVVRTRPGYASEMMGWFAKPPITFVGKQENLRGDLVFVLNRMGYTFDETYILGANRVLKSIEVPIEWDPKLKEQVVKLEYAGLVRYGYDVEATMGR
jgi:hypothetical protein